MHIAHCQLQCLFKYNIIIQRRINTVFENKRTEPSSAKILSRITHWAIRRTRNLHPRIQNYDWNIWLRCLGKYHTTLYLFKADISCQNCAELSAIRVQALYCHSKSTMCKLMFSSCRETISNFSMCSKSSIKLHALIQYRWKRRSLTENITKAVVLACILESIHTIYRKI